MTKRKFMKRSRQWHEETAHLSSVTEMMNNSSIKEIIEAGESVVPFIIDEMIETLNGHWGMVLSEITECNIVPKHHSGYIRLMANDWIKWYHEIYLTGK